MTYSTLGKNSYKQFFIVVGVGRFLKAQQGVRYVFLVFRDLEQS